MKKNIYNLRIQIYRLLFKIDLRVCEYTSLITKLSIAVHPDVVRLKNGTLYNKKFAQVHSEK